MNEFRRRTLLLIILNMAVAIAIALQWKWIIALCFLIVLLAISLGFHWYWIVQLDLWLRQTGNQEMPVGKGIWESIFSRIRKKIQQCENEKTQLSIVLHRFQQAARALPDGVVMINRNDQIEWCNQMAETHLGLDLRQDYRKPIQYLVRQADFIEYLSSNDYQEPIRLTSLRALNTVLQLQVVAVGTHDKLVLCRDITPLEQLDTMRRDFIANVSHELRTPLTIINGFLEALIEHQPEPPDQERMTQYSLMYEQGKRMQALIDELLILARLEQDNYPHKEETLTMADLLQPIISMANNLSAGRHEIKFNINQELKIIGDQEELYSVFLNLISNAIRYTPERGKITIVWEKRGKQGCFSVIDNGVGIAAGHLQRLTERFYRVDQSRSRSTGGTGLGLSIVKHVLQRHQATLEIQSVVGKGSTFTAVFPAAKVTEEQSE